jgi:hypothetical protein
MDSMSRGVSKREEPSRSRDAALFEEDSVRDEEVEIGPRAFNESLSDRCLR